MTERGESGSPVRMTADGLVLRIVRIGIVAAAIALVCRHFIVEPVPTRRGVVLVDRITPLVRSWGAGEPVCAILDSGYGRVGHFVTESPRREIAVSGGDLVELGLVKLGVARGASAVDDAGFATGTPTSTADSPDVASAIWRKPESLQSRLWSPLRMDARVGTADSFAWEEREGKWQFASLGESGPPLRVVVPPAEEAPDQRITFRVRVLSGAGRLEVADDRPPRVAVRVSFGGPSPVEVWIGGAVVEAPELGPALESNRYRMPRKAEIDFRRVDRRVELRVDGALIAAAPAPLPYSTTELEKIRAEKVRAAQAEKRAPVLEPIAAPAFALRIEDGAGFVSDLEVAIDPPFAALDSRADEGPTTLTEIGEDRRRPPAVLACHDDDDAWSSFAPDGLRSGERMASPQLAARVFESSRIRGRALLEVRTDPWSLRWIR